MKNVVRRVEYSNGRCIYDGVFHQWVKKVDEKGNEESYGLIEGEDGYLIEIKYDYFRFIAVIN
ncbi:hypothetical protein HX017_03200 [Myroides marinus]|uniref:hypothetical protein n=1 Tax=Myroides marinus TaxID=703342 RepID=UPI0025790517|nr:hypothetical protein [Myroides marinus]MDM1346078.1 hypothetical protein [Myroides marinus]MDM1350870.1 hypothetical protein [Myroides marinus]MDM1353332.1 hypothetical protein [Myroides marinus]MDM1358077.1 hypothetical protein [Myroides marinus]MDM1363958.1 hypothetical protein [Myroides marinus]